MISFDSNGWRFHYRAAGLALHPSGDGRILVCTEPHLPFSYLPGGRVEAGETAADALSREMQEEMGLTPQMERLLFVVENLFRDEHGTPNHEVGLYFLLSFAPDAWVYEPETESWWRRTDEMDRELDFWWKHPAAPDSHPLVPAFLREVLQKPLPDTPQHLVNRERLENGGIL